MPKKVIKEIGLQIKAGSANPAPPIGPALGQVGVNIMDFCKQFNEATKDQQDIIIPVVISVYADKTFSFVLKSPPAAILIKKMLNIELGAQKTGTEIIGTIDKNKLAEIAKIKINDLNTNSIEEAVKIITGTAKSMGVKVVDVQE